MFLEYFFKTSTYRHDVENKFNYDHIIDLTTFSEDMCTCREDENCESTCTNECDFDAEIIRVIMLLNRIGFVTSDDMIDTNFVEFATDREDEVIRLRFKNKEYAAEFKMLYVEWV